MDIQTVTYCSFADNKGCRGVLILPGDLDPVEAAIMAHAIGQNPGGQLLAVPVTQDESPPDMWIKMIKNINRLLTGDEAMQLFAAKRLGDWENEPKMGDSY